MTVTRNRIVLFGGSDTRLNVHVGDTWEWDAENWKQHSAFGPPPRRNTAMAYDIFRERVVLFGGALLGTADPVISGTFKVGARRPDL